MQGKVRLKDIAEKTGVSVGTVSYVLNKANVPISREVRERVLAAAAELNYTTNWTAKSLKLRRYNAIGVIVEDMRSWYIAPLIDGICRYAEENDIRVLLCNLRADSKIHTMTHEDLKEHREQIARQISTTFGNQVDGLIYVGAFFRDVSPVFEPENEKAVFLYSWCGDSDRFPSVAYNDRQGAALAVRHLISRGHTRIVYMNALPGVPGEQRLNGYLDAMAEAGLPVRPEWIQNWDDAPVQIRASLEAMMASENRPTALFASMDSICPQIYSACSAAGIRIPEDLSIVSFDNQDLSLYLVPSLTTVSFPAEQIGYEGAHRICDSTLKSERILLDCSLVERNSVADLK